MARTNQEVPRTDRLCSRAEKLRSFTEDQEKLRHEKLHVWHATLKNIRCSANVSVCNILWTTGQVVAEKTTPGLRGSDPRRTTRLIETLLLKPLRLGAGKSGVIVDVLGGIGVSF